jgi:hypothetical protein
MSPAPHFFRTLALFFVTLVIVWHLGALGAEMTHLAKSHANAVWSERQTEPHHSTSSDWDVRP